MLPPTFSAPFGAFFAISGSAAGSAGKMFAPSHPGRKMEKTVAALFRQMDSPMRSLRWKANRTAQDHHLSVAHAKPLRSPLPCWCRAQKSALCCCASGSWLGRALGVPESNQWSHRSDAPEYRPCPVDEVERKLRVASVLAHAWGRCAPAGIGKPQVSVGLKNGARYCFRCCW